MVTTDGSLEKILNGVDKNYINSAIDHNYKDLKEKYRIDCNRLDNCYLLELYKQLGALSADDIRIFEETSSIFYYVKNINDNLCKLIYDIEKIVNDIVKFRVTSKCDHYDVGVGLGASPLRISEYITRYVFNGFCTEYHITAYSGLFIKLIVFDDRTIAIKIYKNEK